MACIGVCGDSGLSGRGSDCELCGRFSACLLDNALGCELYALSGRASELLFRAAAAAASGLILGGGAGISADPGTFCVVPGGVIMPERKLAGLPMVDLEGVWLPRLVARSDSAPIDVSLALRQFPHAAAAAIGSARGDCA